MFCGKKYCVMFGAGGHAAVLIECLRAQAPGSDLLRAILCDDADRVGDRLLGVPIRGTDKLLPGLVAEGVDSFIAAAGNSLLRRELFELACGQQLHPVTVRHPTAVVSSSADCGLGCQCMPYSVVHSRAKLGQGVVVNTGAIVEHDCVLGDFATVATGVSMAGGVVVGACAAIGAGVSVRPGVSIGSGAIIGAGMAVYRDVPDNTVAVGAKGRQFPARDFHRS